MRKTEYDHREGGSSFDGPLPSIMRDKVDRFLGEETSPQAKERAKKEQEQAQEQARAKFMNEHFPLKR